ncbi:ABC transporter permease [Sneathiella chinensis]|uniref:Glycosyl transferase family 1 n=1 Tax=Sneathiella chinensis TaxID=349750 RepID=A0ABQ5U739_9PROT|nr:FtsX-like permease family protein [Sneathiella chinensis]GLQ07967.1 glycosyl transferase family 1 [Sneathiella chinensis]
MIARNVDSVGPTGEPLSLALKYALRDLRGGLKGFRIFIACLILGVAAIAGVGTLSSSINAGLQANGRVILGGDVDLRLTSRPASPEEYDWITRQGTVSDMQMLRAMAHAVDNPSRVLTELKAVDGVYPLFGSLNVDGQTVDGKMLQGVLGPEGGPFGALVEGTLLDRLKLAVGDKLRIGGLEVTVRGIIQSEPDKASQGMALGPRVIISTEALKQTGLIQPGSLIRFHYRLDLNEGTSIADFRGQVMTALPDAGWRITDSSNGAPGIKRFVDRVALFLTLVGLTALIVGGVGVGNAIRAYLDGKIPSIATLKCLGASSRFIFRMHFLQVLMLAFMGSLIGVLLGLGGAFVASKFLAQALPVPAVVTLQWQPLALAMTYGLLTASLFAIWPLARARETPAASLFRDAFSRHRWPRPAYLVMMGLALAFLIGLAIVTAEEKIFAIGFVAAALGIFALLFGVGYLVQFVARQVPRSRIPYLRLAIANLHRPGAATASVVLSLGLGLTLFVTVALIEGNLRAQVQDQLPENAPAFFFIDIQNDQLDSFVETASSLKGISDINHVPNLRGRIVRVNGVPAAEVAVASDVKWVLRGDRGLTYSRTKPVNAIVVKGEWWPEDYQGKPLISLDQDAARGMGLDIGDTLTVNVMGREITGEIANLREIDWSTLAINFVIVFDAGTLTAAPHSHLATAKADGESEAELFRTITGQFSNISVVRMKEALQTVSRILEQLSSAVTATASITLVAGVFVLAGAFAAGHRKRVYDAVILKVLGATRRDIFKTFLIEYALIGLVTSLIAVAAGWVAAWVVITEILDAKWTHLPGTVAGTILVSVTVTLLFGMYGSWRALGEKTAPVLRSD